jgi:hypothetical protein
MDALDVRMHEPRLRAGAAQVVLPYQLRLLCITPVEPSWTVLALLLDKYGCHEPQFRWCSRAAEALSVLREETFDCVIVGDTVPADGDPASLLDVRSLLDAVATGGSAEPVLVISQRRDDDWLLDVSAFDCELLLTSVGWQSHALPVWIARAVARTHVARENQRLALADRRRSVRERDETEQLLEQQRRILEVALEHTELESPTDDGGGRRTVPGPRVPQLPDQVNEYYQELLRTYVIMGSGSLAAEIRKLAQLLALAGLGPREALQVHLARVETLIRGLGSRSSRHVMNRADILALELLIHLGDCYRRESGARGLGDFGIDLLHEESLRQKGQQA